MLGIKSKLISSWVYRVLKDRDVFSEAKKNEILEATYKEKLEELDSIYAYYVENVSSPEMAASKEVLAFLYAICSVTKPKTVLDLGSGISSYLFRTYQKEEDSSCKVISVDDDKEWLLKSGDFLKSQSLNQDNLITFEEYLQSDLRDVDIIFYDLNFVEERIKHVDSVLKNIAQSGIIVFDDVHKIHYFKQLHTILKANNFNIIGIKKMTKDVFGRFGLIARK